MRTLISLARVTWCGLLTLALAGACGGNSFSRDDEGSGGSQASGGSGSGGKQSQAGSTASGGKQAAGSGNGGTSSSAGTGMGGLPAGSGGSASGGSSPGPECSAPPVSGPCDAAFRRFYHDPATGLCQGFWYGGCQGNANNFESYEACQMACAQADPNLDACVLASDCEIGSTGCCGTCDGPGLTTFDLLVYNQQNRSQVYARCELIDIACEPCAVPAPREESLKYFLPTCSARQCGIQDIRTTPLTACTDSNECKLRYGTSCCEGCSGGGLLAVRNDGKLEQLVCGTEPVACPGCEPIYPPGASALCNEGRCEVVYAIETQ